MNGGHTMKDYNFYAEVEKENGKNYLIEENSVECEENNVDDQLEYWMKNINLKDDEEIVDYGVR